MRSLSSGVALVALFQLLACGGSPESENMAGGTCEPGREGCRCGASDFCLGALSCRSALCVNLRGEDQPSRSSRTSSSAQGRAGQGSVPSAQQKASARQPTAGGGQTRVNDGGSSGTSVDPDEKCIQPGGACTSGSCCGSAFCMSGVCAGPCTDNRDCSSRCCLGGICGSSESCFVSPSVLDASVAECAAAGGDCTGTWCCSGPCIVNVCATPCSSGADCASGCCRATSSGDSLCAPSTLCPGGTPVVVVVAGPSPTAILGGCSALELRADDGKFLGAASSSEYTTDGVCNKYSNYGGQYGTDSIFNQYGSYGGEYSSTSAYSKYTTTPPFLFCATSNERLNPVSKNSVLSGSIDPDLLCAVLRASGY